MKHFLMEPKHDNIAVDSFLGSSMEELSHGFDFSFLPDYGGLDSCITQDMEAVLKFEVCALFMLFITRFLFLFILEMKFLIISYIVDGFLDEFDEVEDIYASHDLSSIGNHFIPVTEVKKEVSELDGEPHGLMNFSSESYSPGVSGRIVPSESSKETVPHAEFPIVSSEKVKDSLDTNSNEMHCSYKSGDDKKPLSTLTGSWVKRGKGRKKNLVNTACSRLDSSGGRMSCVSYNFRPRKGPMEKYIHTSTGNTFSDDQITSSESEDDIAVTNTFKCRSDRRKHQKMWTVDEVVKLVDGISHFGVGKWTNIKNLFFHSASHRTPIDIRDKWRNLLKASYNNKHNDGEAKGKRKSQARSMPKEILHRVREIASLHPHPLSNSSAFVHHSSSSRRTSMQRLKKKKEKLILTVFMEKSTEKP